jgi:iron complex outermembrane recepter protein
MSSGAVAAVMALAVASAAVAEETSDALDSVTVTARRRAENAQSVPIPIATIGAQSLEKSGQFRLEHLNQKLPSTNVQFSNPRQTSIAVRGLGNNPANDALESSVGVYLDDVYLGRPGMANLDLVDIDQVALLRGPQGTLFGKNTTAGVLNIRTQEPSQTPEGRAEVSGGSHDYYQARAALSGPISDSWSGRLSAAKTSKGGYLNDVTDGRDLNGSNRHGFRGQLLYKPGGIFDLRLIGDYNEEDSDCCASVLYSLGPDNGEALFARVAAAGGQVVFDPDYRTVTLNSWQHMDVRQGGGSAQASWKLGDYTLTSVSAYRSWWFTPTNDSDGSSAEALINAGQHVDDEQWSQEIRLSSPSGETIEYVMGLFYFYQKQDNLLYFQYGPAAAQYTGSPALVNAYSQTHQYLKTDSVSVFGQGTWRATDRLSFTAGLRETFEDKSTLIHRDAPTGLPGAQNVFPLYDSGKLRLSDNTLSALGSASYSFTGTLLGYASVSRGAKSGGINPQVPGAGLGTDSLYIDAETVVDYELGIKSTLFDRRLVLNTNLFWTDVKDYHATQLEQTAPGVYIQTLSNIGKVRTRGVETEVTARPIEGLTVALAASFNDALYKEYQNAPCSAEATAAGLKVCDLTGQRLVGAPRWIVNPSVVFEQALFGDLSGYAVTDYAWRSGFYGSADNSKYSLIDSYGIANLRLGISRPVGDNSWDFSLFLDNAFDKRYVVGGVSSSSFGTYSMQPGQPRTVGATLRVEF